MGIRRYEGRHLRQRMGYVNLRLCGSAAAQCGKALPFRRASFVILEPRLGLAEHIDAFSRSGCFWRQSLHD